MVFLGWGGAAGRDVMLALQRVSFHVCGRAAGSPPAAADLLGVEDLECQVRVAEHFDGTGAALGGPRCGPVGDEFREHGLELLEVPLPALVGVDGSDEGARGVALRAAGRVVQRLTADC